MEMDFKNKEEGENKIKKKFKGLQGVIEAQRGIIKDLSDKNLNLYEELRETKKQYEEKKEVLFNVEADNGYYEDSFKLDFSDKEMETIVKFIKRFNEKAERGFINISIYKEVYKND